MKKYSTLIFAIVVIVILAFSLKTTKTHSGKTSYTGAAGQGFTNFIKNSRK
jgi:hypothetical protein